MLTAVSQGLMLVIGIWPVVADAGDATPALVLRRPEWQERSTLKDVAESLAARRLHQLKEHAAKSGEPGEVRGMMGKLTAWVNSEQMPGWTTFEEFVALVGGGPLVNEVSAEADEDNYRGFIDYEGGSVRRALGIPELHRPEFYICFNAKLRSSSFLAKLGKPLVDLKPQLPVTTIKFKHTFWEYIGHLSVKLISDFGDWIDDDFYEGFSHKFLIYHPFGPDHIFPLECVLPSMGVDANGRPKDCLAAFLKINIKELLDPLGNWENRFFTTTSFI